LREEAERDGIRIGATLSAAQISDPRYAATLSREFSALTPENAMKWYATEPTRGGFDFSGADAVMAFAEQHQMEVRGHNLVWAQDRYTPDWVKAITDPADMRAVVRAHIAAVMGRYKGRIHRWDVVNEPLARLGAGPGDNVFRRVLGPGWIAEAFRDAHEVDPSAELWLNEASTDWVPGKHDALVALVRGLLADGVPIAGVGLQTHRPGVAGPNEAAFERTLNDFASLGVKVAITELDVPTKPGDPTGLVRQAQAYRTIVSSCLAVPACTEVTTWGLSDAHTWLNATGTFPTPTRPLMFDDEYRAKPAFDAVRAALAAGR
jgi:endo-1,4-beta-xylanase